MNEEREKVRCRHCELANWSDEGNCRRCGEPLPAPLVNVIERVEEKIVVRQDPRCLECLERACSLISAAIERLTQPCVEPRVQVVMGQVPGAKTFPTMAEMERSMILSAYERSERKPLVAAQLLGIGKTTFYRKLKEMSQAQRAETTSLKLAA
jgi:DNA-binding NtrC family response regulator